MGNKITDNTILGVVTILSIIVFGIFIGEAVTSLERASMLSGQLVTIVSLIIGPKVLWSGIVNKLWFLVSAVISIWVANIAFSLQLISLEPIEDMLFDVATFFTMIALLKHSVDKTTIYHFVDRRKNKESIYCRECGIPMEEEKDIKN